MKRSPRRLARDFDPTPGAPDHHLIPLSGDDSNYLEKQLVKAHATAGVLAGHRAEVRACGGTLIREAGNLVCQSCNETMGSDGGPATKRRQRRAGPRHDRPET